MFKIGDYARTISGPEAPMKVTEVGNGWVELQQGLSRFRMETALLVNLSANDDLTTDATGARYVPWIPGTCGDPNPSAY